VSPENVLLIARRGEHFVKFWKYAEEDEDDAPPAIKALIAGLDPVPVTQEEADEALAWCRGRIGWAPLSGPSPVERWPVEVLHSRLSRFFR
jgi:hypothetical protein